MYLFKLFFFFFTVYSIETVDLTPIVNTESGPIQGVSIDAFGSSVYHFLGVPYAEPPVNLKRFQIPEPHQPWTEVRQTLNYGASCPQRNQNIPSNMTDEDCLFLNIIVNKKTLENSSKSKRPVLFWIHGGALSMGSGNEAYPGIPMVPLHDVILVTHNYRLNAFGFMYFGEAEPRIPANLGLRDQQLALKWVKANIDKFGGDPDSITIFGESAGAMSVSAHLIAPSSKGLFKRAIIESGTIMVPSFNQDNLIANSFRVLNRTSCANSGDILGCLQSLDFQTLIDIQLDGILRFRWYIGDDFLPNDTEKALASGLLDNTMNILLGSEVDEFSIFMTYLDYNETLNPLNPTEMSVEKAVDLLSILYDQMGLEYFSQVYLGAIQDSDELRKAVVQAYSDATLTCPTYVLGAKFAQNSFGNSGRVYAYYHTQKPQNSFFPLCTTSPWLGVCHASELPHVFGLPLTFPGVYSEEDRQLSLLMMKIWTKFAETGEPPLIKGQRWKPFQEDLSAVILNNHQLGQVDRERVNFCVQQWPTLKQHSTSQLIDTLAVA